MRQILGWGVLGLAWVATAGAATFDFKDPKGVNTVTFTLDAPLEAIRGAANGVSGKVEFDPANPAATRGTITLDAASLQVPHPVMQQHMHGKDWMDVATHPTLTFAVKSLAGVRTEGDVTTADVTGALTVKGITKEVRVPVRMTYLKDKLKARSGGPKDGDLLVLRATFTIRRSDFGINPGAPADKVAEEVELSLSLAGSSPRG